MTISYQKLEEVAYELNRRAAIAVPLDAKNAFVKAAERETHPDAKRALLAVINNADVAVSQQSSMCGDTGLPRFYVKAGNDVRLDDGFVGLERALRAATARATKDVPLRSNRVHPLTRRNPGTNVGVMAPNIDYRFEPEGDWIDMTAVHKGGLFGSDYRMLFPGDGIPGLKRFFVDTLVSFGHRGLSCPPVIMGVGIGGTKDQCVTLGKEASCLRLVGDRHPDPLVAKLELELLELGNRTMIGIMGFQSDTPVLDVHCEIAYAHTGGLPVGISELCHAVRRATARIYNDGRVEYREDPQWFTPYYRREGINFEPGEAQPSTKGGEGMKGLAQLGSQKEASPGVAKTNGKAKVHRESKEWHLNIPLSEKDVRQLRAGDVVYLSGCIFTARDGVFKYMIDEGHEPPIPIRDVFNVTTQSSPAGTEVSPGKYMVNSLQATAGFRYAQWMDRLMERHGVRAVLNKGGMSQQMYQTVFKKHGAVCLSTMPYGIGAIYGKAVTGVRDVYWKELLGISEAIWLLEVEELGPLLVDGDSEGNSYVADHAEEVNAPLLEIYKDLPELILKRFGEVTDPTQELIKEYVAANPDNFVTHLQCSLNGDHYAAGQLHNLSKAGKPLLVRYDLDRLAASVSKTQLAARPEDMWRYREFLPVRRTENIVSLGEVRTPLIECGELARQLGARRLIIKDEGRLPTGSFKARGLVMAVSMAKELGVKRLAMPTNGNAGAAMAAYAARAGMESFVFCPDDTPAVNVGEIAAQGAHVWLVNGLINDCGRIVGEGREAMGWFDVSTLKEPYRIEGKKTMGLELADQLGWTLPDVIFYPTGGGTGLIGMWKAFDELGRIGWIDKKRPRMVAVQASGCAPIVKAFEEGLDHAPLWKNAHTVAAGIRVPGAVGDFLMLRAIRESNGFAIAVDDDAILAARDEVASVEGLLMCPEGAATYAAYKTALADGRISADESAVLFNCAIGVKYPLPAVTKHLDCHSPVDYERLAADAHR